MNDCRDVVIFEIATKRIDTIAGTNLPWQGRGESVERRLATVLSRLNDRYDACTVPTGKYKVGDVLEPCDQHEDWSETKKVIREERE